jgi:hypothetical protein
MLKKRRMYAALASFTLSGIVCVAANPAASNPAMLAGKSHQSLSASPTANWESPARMHRGIFLSKDRGTLLIDDKSVEYRPGKGPVLNWPFLDIYAVSIAPHRLVIETYSNRSLHRPGLQKYAFDLAQPMPAAVAGILTKAVLRPSVNTVPDPDLAVGISIPVHHRRPTGGTNGILRFRADGIDYVTDKSGDSRSWRWADIQTLSHPDPYHLFVFGYRDNYVFDLKQTISRDLFNQLSDQVWSHNDAQSEDFPIPFPAHVPKDRLTVGR